ncbi:MAG: hypothetical protein WBP81_07090 [Solirubrobacteraceae bacterium]
MLAVAVVPGQAGAAKLEDVGEAVMAIGQELLSNPVYRGLIAGELRSSIHWTPETAGCSRNNLGTLA